MHCRPPIVRVFVVVFVKKVGVIEWVHGVHDVHDVVVAAVVVGYLHWMEHPAAAVAAAVAAGVE